jgi:hypothetical protein
MTDTQITLTQEEVNHLVALLQTTLKQRRVEEHRTRTPSYREHVVRDEECLASVLKKLGRAPD